MSEHDSRLDEFVERFPHHTQRINALKSQNIDSETIINIIRNELKERLSEIQASFQDDIDDGFSPDNSYESSSESYSSYSESSSFDL